MVVVVVVFGDGGVVCMHTMKMWKICDVEHQYGLSNFDILISDENPILSSMKKTDYKFSIIQIQPKIQLQTNSCVRANEHHVNL